MSNTQQTLLLRHCKIVIVDRYMKLMSKLISENPVSIGPLLQISLTRKLLQVL